MTAAEMSTWLFFGVSIVALSAAFVYQWFWGSHFSQQKQGRSYGDTPHQLRSRDLTLRVDLIPPGTSSAELEGQLNSIIHGSPDLQDQLVGLVVRSITARDHTCMCASVTVKTELPQEQLLARLQDASKAHPYRYDCSFYGITPLYEDASGVHCDVVAVPGLASHAIGSWKTPGANDLWLRDWLSDDISNIRVLLYGYDTKLLKSNSKASVEDLGRRFLESLTAYRVSDKTERRPIILIGHSLGGLLIKEALLHAARSPDSHRTHQFLAEVCCGLLLFGVPQRGLRNEKLSSVVGGQPNQALIRSLVVDDESEPSSFLARMSDDFARHFQRRLRVVSFFEGRLSATVAIQPDGVLRKSGPPVLMVTKTSATTPGEDTVFLDTDHSGLVKFESRRDDSYVVVKERINSMMSSAASEPEDQRAPRQQRNNGNVQQDQRFTDECLGYLRITDPRGDKGRIENTKGGLRKNSYVWVLGNPDFCRWRDDPAQHLFWVKGDPGKGKTMLLCGIIDELEVIRAQGKLLSFFFCQATDERLNTATAVLRGLIFMLLNQDLSLISHIVKHKPAGKALFEGLNAWYVMREIFADMLRDPKLQGVYFLVDALDECATDLDQLLDLIVETSESTKAKWLVSSRNWTRIEERLRNVSQRLSLEVNAKSVSEAVQSYIDSKISQLSERKGYSSDTACQIRQYLSSNADGTFLWVALVCKELEKTSKWYALQTIKSFPRGLDALYERMMQQIKEEEDAELCWQILAIMTTTYRPLSLAELTMLIGGHHPLASNVKFLQDVVSTCGSFLTIREDTVYFIHQSAKDFLLNKSYKALGQILPFGIVHQHHAIFSRSLEVLSRTLRRNIYELPNPGSSVEEITRRLRPDPDPLTSLKYSSTHWIDHLKDSEPAENPARGDLRDNAGVHTFLKDHYIHWLEAQILLKGVPQAVVGMQKLRTLVTSNIQTQLADLVHDAFRFILSYKQCVESFPLQLYASALLFSPTRSLVRQLFQAEAPSCFRVITGGEAHWSACLQTMEGHDDWVHSVAFSPDGRQLASASSDDTIRLWDTITGQSLKKLQGHRNEVKSVAFSPDGRQLASASRDHTIMLWDVVTGQHQKTFSGHSNHGMSVAFSYDGRQLASSSKDHTIKLWDIVTGQHQKTLHGHSDEVNSVAFSPDGRQLASASDDLTIRLWSLATGLCEKKLEGHTKLVSSVAFSFNGHQLASGSSDHTVKLWDATTGKCQKTLEGHREFVVEVAYSPDGRQLASVSNDNTIRLWDVATGQSQHILNGNRGAVAFSPDGRWLAAGSEHAVKLWDTALVQHQQTQESHSDFVRCLAFSPDGRHLASSSDDANIRLWDTATGQCQTLKGHRDRVYSVTFSPNGRQLASGSNDNTIRLWDTGTGHYQTFKGHGNDVNSVAFSPDGRQLASASDDTTVRLWDITTGRYQTLEGHYSDVNSVAFSPDGRQLASVSDDATLRQWDITTGQCQTRYGHESVNREVAFSSDGRQLFISSTDNFVSPDNTIIRICDTATGQCLQKPERHTRDPRQSVNQYDVLAIDGSWITKDSENILRLPQEYCWHTYAVYGTRIAIGCLSGRVLLLQVG